MLPFPRIPGLHELDKGHIQPGSCRPYGQANCPGGLSNYTPMINQDLRPQATGSRHCFFIEDADAFNKKVASFSKKY